MNGRLNGDISDSKSKRKGRRVLKIIAVALMEIIVFCSGFMGGMYFDNHNPINAPKAPQGIQTPVSQYVSANEDTNSIVQAMIDDMTTSELIYQMMFVTPESITGVGKVLRAGDATKQALQKYPVGGIIYFSQNFESRAQTSEMIAKTQQFSKIPLFISVDEEGGIVSRLGSNPNMGITKQPPMKTIGETRDPSRAYEVGKTLANDLSALGFNVDFAPDADVLVNPNNKEIGSRSFGTDPVLVSTMVESAVKGLEENGVSATIKHFPGHGSTYVDSHTGYSESPRTIEELRSTEFLPFKAGIGAGVDFIMVSHMTPVNATTQKLPASISKEVITDMLINELGYKGIIITDSFSMGAITENHTPGEAAEKAINAGVDMILMPSSIDETHSSLLASVENGQLSRERLESSVRKILALKLEKGMIK